MDEPGAYLRQPNNRRLRRLNLRGRHRADRRPEHRIRPLERVRETPDSPDNHSALHRAPVNPLLPGPEDRLPAIRRAAAMPSERPPPFRMKTTICERRMGNRPRISTWFRRSNRLKKKSTTPVVVVPVPGRLLRRWEPDLVRPPRPLLRIHPGPRGRRPTIRRRHHRALRLPRRTNPLPPIHRRRRRQERRPNCEKPAPVPRPPTGKAVPW